jgi:RNA polymerase sigma-70 factor (ECF subfamily)
MAVTETTNVERDRRLSQMEAIVAEHEQPLLRYAARLLRNATAAEDVVQNAFIKLFRQWDEGMRPSPNLKAWLYRVTHNEAVDHIRRESRLKLLHEREAADPAVGCPDGLHCDPAAGDDERRAMVLRHLGRLHPREQQVVLLRLESGLSYAEISRITGRSEGNVGNILHHAVRKLSESLRRSGVIAATEGVPS